MTKKEKMYNSIRNHGNNLKFLFNVEMDSIALCKKLFRLETKAHKLSTDYCNGLIDCDVWEIKSKEILNKVSKILNCNTNNLFVNGDARGYALKIDDDFVKDKSIYKDWGGYGILAPDFKEGI
jgi:hypothetical protein